MKRALLLVGGLIAALVARGDSATPEIAQSEAQADYVRFESRAWAADVHGEGGRLAANTVWTGEHVIVSDVYVPSGVTLTLAPGATIRFCEGTRIKVEDGGSLILNDAADGEIVLTGLAADTAFVGITLQSDSATFRDNGHAENKIKKDYSYDERYDQGAHYGVSKVCNTSRIHQARNSV